MAAATCRAQAPWFEPCPARATFSVPAAAVSDWEQMTRRDSLYRAGWVRIPALVWIGLALSGCGGNQNTLHPASHAEHEISTLFWVVFGASVAGFALVVWLLFLGWWRRTQASL